MMNHDLTFTTKELLVIDRALWMYEERSVDEEILVNMILKKIGDRTRDDMKRERKDE